METLCPECMAPLESADGQTARCAAHGGEYKILFRRKIFSSPAPPPILPEAQVMAVAEDNAPPVIMTPTPGSVCVQHPSATAAYTCQNCCADICEACDFPQADGSHLCPTCARQQAIATAKAPPLMMVAPPLIETAPPVMRPAISMPDGVRCAQHTHVQATAKCKACGGFMCQTCTFDLPGGVKICPTCATATPKLSAKGKKFLIASYVLAAWCTVVLVGGFAGGRFVQDKSSEQALGLALIVFLPVPALVGLSLGVCAMDRRVPNTVAMWIATAWNGLMLGTFVIIFILGMAKGGAE